jgi:uncharacterized protein YfkK (UPF0435 family)
MRLDKEFCNLQRRINKRQSNGAMLEKMMSKIKIDLNVLTSLMKNRVVSNLNRTLVVTIHKIRMRKGRFSYLQVTNITKQSLW